MTSSIFIIIHYNILYRLHLEGQALGSCDYSFSINLYPSPRTLTIRMRGSDSRRRLSFEMKT